jgi:hypothetical protein
MNLFRFSLADLLFVVGAAPMWIWLMVKLPSSTGWGENPFRFLVPPFVLSVLMVVFYLSLLPWRHAWSAAMLIAGLISTAVLVLVAAFA